jgi:glyoxylase-like metal-dependent hydrolase (beta-lactamase superfamily II)
MLRVHSGNQEMSMKYFPLRLTIPGVAALVITALSSSTQAQDEAVEYIATPLTDTLTMIKGRGGNIAVSAGGDGVYIIDDQVEPLTDQLLAAISKISDQPIRFVINTHYHGDHVGGNEAIGKGGAVIVAHDNIHKRMSRDQFSHFWNNTTPAWPEGALPVITFNDKVTLHFNGEEAIVHHVPQGHTDGDSIVHFPASNVIHMGDIYFNGLYPFIDLDGGGGIQGMVAGAELALSLANAETQIIPGHGPLSDRKSLDEYRSFLIKARDNVQQLVDEGNTLEQAIAARPTAEWDAILGEVWITPQQLVTFIYNSLTGVNHFTSLEAPKSE